MPNPIPVSEAVAIAEALAPYQPRFYEEPLAYTNLDGYAELRARSSIPIAASESLCSLDQFHQLISRSCVHVIQPDIGFVGRLQETVRVVHHAEASNVSTAITRVRRWVHRSRLRCILPLLPIRSNGASKSRRPARFSGRS